MSLYAMASLVWSEGKKTTPKCLCIFCLPAFELNELANEREMIEG